MPPASPAALGATFGRTTEQTGWCSSQRRRGSWTLTFLLRPHLATAVGKVAAFVIQLAQDHVVLEEKLVSHAKSAGRGREKHSERGIKIWKWVSVLASRWRQSESRAPSGAFFFPPPAYFLCSTRPLFFVSFLRFFTYCRCYPTKVNLVCLQGD